VRFVKYSLLLDAELPLRAGRIPNIVSSSSAIVRQTFETCFERAELFAIYLRRMKQRHRIEMDVDAKVDIQRGRTKISLVLEELDDDEIEGRTCGKNVSVLRRDVRKNRRWHFPTRAREFHA